MSIKSQSDKVRKNVHLHQSFSWHAGVPMYGGHPASFPWTARQKRQTKSNRKTRKQDRTGRVAAKFARKTK